MEFFDKLSKKATEAYKITADKTGKIAKETKMRLKISELKSQVNDLYEEIGKKIYEKHVLKEDADMKKIEEVCIQIDVLSDEIDSLLKQCLELRDKKQCKKCFTEIDKDVKFCPNCGEKQEDEPKQVEILEEVEVSKAEEDDNIDSSISPYESETEQTEESSTDEEQEKNNLEKTVEVESNVEGKDKE